MSSVICQSVKKKLGFDLLVFTAPEDKLSPRGETYREEYFPSIKDFYFLFGSVIIVCHKGFAEKLSALAGEWNTSRAALDAVQSSLVQSGGGQKQGWHSPSTRKGESAH